MKENAVTEAKINQQNVLCVQMDVLDVKNVR